MRGSSVRSSTVLCTRQHDNLYFHQDDRIGIIYLQLKTESLLPANIEIEFQTYPDLYELYHIPLIDRIALTKYVL
jgi:hypothetical protein